jgi:hypothetical protein
MHDKQPGDWFAVVVGALIFGTGAVFGWCVAWGVLWL